MKQGTYFRIMLLALAISVPTLIFVIYRMDPRSGAVSISLFLFALFSSILSIFALLSFFFTQKIRKNELVHRAMVTSTRRGFLFGFYAVAALALSAIELLTWWDALLLAFSLVLFELYFMSGKERAL